ncbi:syntaxin-10 [Erinaceus europaeus]|uniref:Syntaxin-10 n=1 Tax=Erinaceus europaeus TaxID=9365 RepID=A0ABM3WPE2_ERIEU|nr:syntaxin-10 [Erinaceus europaeus]
MARTSVTPPPRGGGVRSADTHAKGAEVPILWHSLCGLSGRTGRSRSLWWRDRIPQAGPGRRPPQSPSQGRRAGWEVPPPSGRTGTACPWKIPSSWSGARCRRREHWAELLLDGAAVGAERDWTESELRSSVRCIEWDLEDAEETIGIVEANPSRFKLPAGSLQERKVFVRCMREAVQEMRDLMVCPEALALLERSSREPLVGPPAAQKPPSDLLDARAISANALLFGRAAGGGGACGHASAPQPIGDQLGAGPECLKTHPHNPQLILDEQLDLVSGSIRTLKPMSSRVGEELDEQSTLLDAFAQDLGAHAVPDGVLWRMDKVMHMTSDGRQWCAIAVLSGLLLLVLILLFAL